MQTNMQNFLNIPVNFIHPYVKVLLQKPFDYFQFAIFSKFAHSYPREVDIVVVIKSRVM